MALPLLQILAITLVAVCLSIARSAMRRRNAQSWDAIVSRMRPDPRVKSLADESIWNGSMNVTPEEKWRLIRGAQGLWTIYENARVMLEMADYTAKNSESVDLELLASLRSDAMQIRVCVLSALTKYAFSQVNESICVNVTRAAAMYSEMTARTAELLKVNGCSMAPNFVPAM
jgi:hypothetical protein